MQDAGTVKTGKLYDVDAYRREFSAKVMSVSGNDVVLDATLFFPEEGGQEADRGMLGGYEVEDVLIRDGEIHHLLRVSEEEKESFGAVFVPGAEAAGLIDFERRFSNMQQHSGEHIFSGIVHKRFGLDNVGFHLSEREVTLDFNGVLTMEQLLSAEEEANRVIMSDVKSEILLTTREERARIDYRSKLDLDGEVRLVIFPGADICACCAPHVRRTGEIGLLKVIGAVRWKSGIRVNILCGKRALKHYDREHELLTAAANELTTAAEQVPALLMRLRDENRRLKAALSEARAELLLHEAVQADPRQRILVLFRRELEPETARRALNAIIRERGGLTAVFFGNDRGGYSFVIGSADFDCRKLMTELKEVLKARGGGKAAFVQGSVNADEMTIRAFLSEVDFSAAVCR